MTRATPALTRARPALRQLSHAAVVTALATVLTACAGEVVHAPNGDRVNPVTAPSAFAGDECVIRIDVFDTSELLRPTQIMPAAGDHGAGQESSMYRIAPSLCGGNGYIPPRCDTGFPWTGPDGDDVGAVLGPIGVTSLVTSTSRYDEPAASVTETIVTLSGTAGDILAEFAGTCGYVQLQGDIYAADLGNGAYQMLQIRDDVAVGVEFDGTGLNASDRWDVLAAAVAQVPPP